MPALAHEIHTQAAPRRYAPALRALPRHPLRRRPRLPAARSVAVYALGLTVGFVLAAAASGPGGSALVGGQLRLAAAAGLVAALAGLRAALRSRSAE